MFPYLKLISDLEKKLLVSFMNNPHPNLCLWGVTFVLYVNTLENVMTSMSQD